MPEPRIKLQDRLLANTLSAGSAVASMLPDQLNFTVNTDAPSSTPLRWHHVGRPAESMKAEWVTHEGDDDAGLLPRNFKKAAIIIIDRAYMDKLRWLHGECQDAVAYKLGSAVMMGTSSRDEIFGLEHEGSDEYKVAMGIGKGPLEASVGIAALRGNSYSTSWLYSPLGTGVHAGPVVPISELPDTIPYV